VVNKLGADKISIHRRIWQLLFLLCLPP